MAQLTQGVEHVGLTVRNVEESAAFFIDVLGFKKIGEKPDYPAVFVTDGTTKITLWQAKDASSATPFDRNNNIGLHHLAFKLESFEALDATYEKIKVVKGVTIEFAPELMGQGPSRHMMFYEPGGTRIELIVRKHVTQ